MTSDERYVVALVRCMIVQAVRDGELQLADRSDRELRADIRQWMRSLIDSQWQAAVQAEHDPKLTQAGLRFAAEGEAELAIVMYATALEHWLNGMIEIGLKRRGENLRPASEWGTIEVKLTTRWRDFFDVEIPEHVLLEIRRLVRARNDFVHYKWPSRSEQEHDIHTGETARIARDAPTIFVALDKLENLLVFNEERERLERILDEMQLFDIPRAPAQ